MEENDREFVAFSRKLLRSLKEIKRLLDKAENEKAKVILNELIEDSEKDIEE